MLSRGYFDERKNRSAFPSTPHYSRLLPMILSVLSHSLARTCEFMLLGPALFLHPTFRTWLLLKLPQNTTHKEQTRGSLAEPQSRRGPVSSFIPLAQPAGGDQTIRDSLMTLERLPLMREAQTLPFWAESPWLWLHPPSSRLHLKPGAAEPQFEVLSI